MPAPKGLAAAAPLWPRRSPVLPLEVSYMKRADSSPGTEPSTVSSNASRPWASPLHIPDRAGEAFRAEFLESGEGGSEHREGLVGLPRQPFWLTG